MTLRDLLLLLVSCNWFKMIVLAVKYFTVACFLQVHSCTYLRFMLFNCNLFNYMLLWFFPLALIWGFSQCMLHVWLPAMFGDISLLWSVTYALLLMLSSAKWIHVNVISQQIFTFYLFKKTWYYFSCNLYSVWIKCRVNLTQNITFKSIPFCERPL